MKRLGIVGCGKAGHQHVEAVRGLDDVEVVATFDKLGSAEIAGVPSVNTFDELIDECRLDALAFCCPPGDRTPQVLAAVDAGISVLLEKPQAASIRDHDGIVRLAQERNVTVHAMLQHRFRVPEASLGHDGGPDSFGTLLVSRQRSLEALAAGWRADDALSLGGIVAHLGIHYLDVAVEWLGTPARFTASTVRVSPGRIESVLAGCLHFEGGATLQMVVTGATQARLEAVHVVSGERSSSLVDGRHASSQPVEGHAAVQGGNVASLRRLVYADFLRAPAQGQYAPARCALARTRRVQSAMDMIRASLSAGPLKEERR